MDEEKMKQFIKSDDFAKAFAYLLTLFKEMKTDTTDALGETSQLVHSKTKEVSDKIDIFHTTHTEALDTSEKKIRTEIMGHLNDIKVYIDETIEKSLPEEKGEYQYSLSDDDKDEMVKLLSSEFPKDKLTDIENLVNGFSAEIEKIRQAQMMSGGSDIAAPFEPNIKGGTNITVRKTGSGFVIDSTATGGGSLAYETPVGTIDGVNTTFTVSHTPIAIILNQQTYFENDGYTFNLATLTVTMLVTPVTGSTLRSQYNS